MEVSEDFSASLKGKAKPTWVFVSVAADNNALIEKCWLRVWVITRQPPWIL